MKNKRLQRFKQLARQYHRNRRGDQFENGILVRHLYNGEGTDGLSWWDDLAFILGKMRVNVAWRHPRFEYQSLIHDDADAATAHLHEGLDLFANQKAIYKQVGRSRKRITGYQTDGTGDSPWLAALHAEESRLSRDGSYTVRASMKISIVSWCRFVEICAPLEVRNVSELQALADLVRRILLRQTTIEKEFPDYAYTRENWLAENLVDKVGSLHSKALAL